MTALFPGTIETIGATPAVLRTLLLGLPEGLTGTCGDGDWAPVDVVAHLVVAGRLGALERARRALTEDSPSFAWYDEEGELNASGLRGRPVAELIALLESERAGHPALTGELSSTDLERSGVHEEVGAVTVLELLHQAAYHDSLHVAQIADHISGSFAGGRGPLAGSSS